MGSLPNLNELSQVKEKRRTLARERDEARERARQQDFARDNTDAVAGKECLPMLYQVICQTMQSFDNNETHLSLLQFSVCLFVGSFRF